MTHFRNTLFFFTLALGSLGACSGEPPGAPACGELPACGGDIVGTWAVSEQCVTSVDARGCGIALVTDNSDLTGTITFNDDGTYSRNTVGSGTLVVSVPAGCFQGQISDCSGLDDATTRCNGDASIACECIIDTASMITDPGTYSVTGNAMTLDGESGQYCVDGDGMSLKIDNGAIEFSLERTGE